MADGFDVLRNDRAFIEVSGYIMGGLLNILGSTADDLNIKPNDRLLEELHAAFKGFNQGYL